MCNICKTNPRCCRNKRWRYFLVYTCYPPPPKSAPLSCRTNTVLSGQWSTALSLCCQVPRKPILVFFFFHTSLETVRNFSPLIQLNWLIEHLRADKPRGSFWKKIWDLVNHLLCKVTVVAGHEKQKQNQKTTNFCTNTKSLAGPKHADSPQP